MIDFEDLKTIYAKRYKDALLSLTSNLNEFINEIVNEEELPRIDRVSVRAKSVESFIDKAKYREDGAYYYSDPINQIQDQIGARITTFYLIDVDNIANIIKERFAPIEEEIKAPPEKASFGYEGRHFTLFLPENVYSQNSDDDIFPKFFELQIKTLFQHAWAEANHDLVYKKDDDLTDEQERKVAFSAAQAWGADMIFKELAEELINDDHH